LSYYFEYIDADGNHGGQPGSQLIEVAKVAELLRMTLPPE
jgi:hypothetical protein